MENWIKQRYDEDRLYFSQGPILWNDLKEALRFSVTEYHKHYVQAGIEEINFEACAGGDPNCVRMRKTPSPQPKALEVRFDIQKLAVTWADVAMMPDKSKPTIKLSINDGKVELLSDGKSVDVAEASKIILEGFLFPNGRRQPTSV